MTNTPTTSYDGAQMTRLQFNKAVNVELEAIKLGILEVMCDETMNLGSYGEHEVRNEDRANMGRNENIGLMCQ